MLPEEVAQARWEQVDADDAFTALVRLGAPGDARRSSVLFRLSGHVWVRTREERYLTVHGEEGSLHYAISRLAGIERAAGVPTIAWASPSRPEWRSEPIPNGFSGGLPPIANDLHRDWACLAREFVADIRGEACDPYPTFRQGWLNQEIADLVRASAGWGGIGAD